MIGSIDSSGKYLYSSGIRRGILHFKDAGRFISQIGCQPGWLIKQKITKLEIWKSGITQKNMVNFKRMKDPNTGEYKNFKYPSFIDIPFNPDTDEYPYPIESINMTYDGLHPADKGNAAIAKMLVKVMKKF
jgi:hypothetical protein